MHAWSPLCVISVLLCYEFITLVVFREQKQWQEHLAAVPRRAAGAGCSEVQLAQTPHGQPPLLHPNTFFVAFTNRCGVSSACPSQEPTKYPPVKCPHPAPPKSSLGKELFPPAHETAGADSDVSPLASLAPLHSCKKIIRGGKIPQLGSVRSGVSGLI